MATLKIFLYNTFSFFSAFLHGKIYWKANIFKQINCNIDARTYLNKPYSLRLVNIGMGTAIGANSKISITTIGRFCSIGPNFLCGWGLHPVSGISINPAFYSTARQNGFTYSKTDKIDERKPIRIGNDVFIGANVTVLDGITIGDGAVIGAGAIVSKDIPPYAIAIGCPIKIIKYRFDPEIIKELLELQWWNKDEAVFKKVEQHFFDVENFLKEMKEVKET